MHSKCVQHTKKYHNRRIYTVKTINNNKHSFTWCVYCDIFGVRHTSFLRPLFSAIACFSSEIYSGSFPCISDFHFHSSFCYLNYIPSINVSQAANALCTLLDWNPCSIEIWLIKVKIPMGTHTIICIRNSNWGNTALVHDSQSFQVFLCGW